MDQTTGSAHVDSEIRPFWREPLSGGGSEIASRLRKVTGEVLGDARRVTALLSGGLDSRVVVSLLMEQNADVSALNFGQPGTQDEVFAREFAEHAGVRFYHMPRDPRECGHLNMARRRIEAYGLASDMPSVVWTGLGASNLLGGVHVTEQVAIRLRAGDLGGAAAALCASEGYAIPRRLFSGDVAALEAAVRANMAAEFEHYATRDMAHAFTLYLLFNRERAGAEVANEGIAEHGLYAVSPFIDEQVLRLALGIDTLELAGHHWYHRWLSELSPVVRSVPWQAYPGHEPCPVPIPAALQDQWQSNDAWREGNRTRQRRKALRALASSHVRREVLAAALILDTLGLRDCSHTIDAAAVFARQ